MATATRSRLQGYPELREARLFQTEVEISSQQRELHRRDMGQAMDVEGEVGDTFKAMWPGISR